MPDYRWSDEAGRFRDATTGRFVPEKQVRDVIDRIADSASQQMAAASQSLIDGRLSLANWETEMRRLVKVSNSATAVIANGGSPSMSPARWGHIGSAIIKPEYQYLHQMAQDIASGAQPLDGRLVSRAKQYGQASRSTFETERTRGARRRGEEECLNVLHATNSCAECIGLSVRGWVPVADMPPVGSRTCRGNCRCTLSFRRATDVASAA